MTFKNLSKTYGILLPVFALGCTFGAGKPDDDSDGSASERSGSRMKPSSAANDDSFSDDPTSDDTGTGTISFGDADGSDDEAAAEDAQGSGPYAMFEAFTIDIQQTITMGSFVMEIGEVEVFGSPDGHEPPEVHFQVNPENLDEDPQTPFLAAFRNEELLLTIDGQYFFGYVYNTDLVRGYLVGESGLAWFIDDPEVTPEDIRSAVITLGPADANQVVIPLAAPEDTVNLNEVPLDPVELVGVDGKLNFTFDDVHLQFSQKSTNSLLDRGTAWLFLGGSVLNTTAGTTCFSDGDFAITPPSGAARIAYSEHFACLIQESEIEEGYVIFEIEAPYPGTYEVRVFDTTFDVVIPEFDL